MLCTQPLLAETYRIGPGDVLELRVLEWDQLESAAVEWEALRGALPVGSDGMVNVPFIGQIDANAMTTAEMGQVVAERLQQRLATSASLDAIVSVTQYSPVYIAGAVRNPGEYPFRPGLVAVQLLAQAGGSSLDQNAVNIDAREIFNREGNISLLHQEGERLAVRRAMLQAAIDGQDAVTMPTTSGDNAWPARLVDVENDVLQLRRQQRARELTALSDQIRLLNNEVDALLERSAALDRLSEIAQSEYESALALVERGLAANARVGEAERSIAQTEAQQLEISTAILRARQGITIAEAEKLALRDREVIEDTRQLQLVDEELERVVTNLDTQQRIALAETGMFVQESLSDEPVTAPVPLVTIRRATPDGITTLTGLETVLEPGDVVEVTLPRMRNRWSQQLPDVVTQ
ncbi:polysaccharide biosynthesis/export family protein [Yoonia sp.]|uniref:polysaccharide biosynthesis/export family protein n=1 Tax=Yoonia sp. TaxID=2212373 RepID=UPI00391951E7